MSDAFDEFCKRAGIKFDLAPGSRFQVAMAAWQASRAVMKEDCAALCEMELPQNDGISCAEAIRELGE